MIAGNIGGSLPGMTIDYSSRTEEMESYDQLPFSVRVALDDFPVKMSAIDALNCFIEIGERQTLEMIKYNKRLFLKRLEDEKLSLLPKEDRKATSNNGS